MIDFERALLLMEVVVEAGKHGPLYQKIAGQAGEELKKMVEGVEREEKLVTPAAGPANSAIQHRDGSVERIVPQTQAPQVPRETPEVPNRPMHTPSEEHVERKV